MLTYTPIAGNDGGPVMTTSTGERLSLAGLMATELPVVRQKLLDHGAILFRGFNVVETSAFDAFAYAVSDRHLEYVYRSTTRKEVSRHVLTATSYPASLAIPLHNENAYQRRWPLMLAFCCTVAAREGGETPIAPMRAVTKRVSAALLDKFERLGVQYIRHYHSNIDLPWQEVFQTTDRAEVATYCDANEIEYAWLDGDLLRTMQVAQGVARHPGTGERLFFNQAHLFHVSSLGEANAQAMIDLFGRDRLPRHARFGDGSELSADELAAVRAAFDTETLAFAWQPGDVLLLDNMQYAHGRRPFKGERHVYAALMNPFSAGDAL